MKIMCVIYFILILICKYFGAEITDIEWAMIAIFYVGDCISDLAKAIERSKGKCV